ncbi:ester cyclase [Nocardia sp. NBC_01730]|uniref:nuclear transport factor 2 family protein n=1 Tax=Nocardia sp. NBC_01730 TaxID=2975998 RepID=UPI002E0D2D17|nr:ester cyclase [Nocardia sp. NBC_01730]
MTDWPVVHERVLTLFGAGWDKPGPHAWDDLLDPDVEFVQPMLRDGRGPASWWGEAERLLELLPDLRGDVLEWAGHDETIFIHVRFRATLGGETFTWQAVDVLRVNNDGRLLRRESFFDSAPLARTVALRPHAWAAWWRSGIAPLSVRRRMRRRRR